MASTSAFRVFTIIILLACSAFGAYGTFGAGFQNGLFPSMNKAAGPEVQTENRYFPGGPKPYKTTYTGITAIDDQLCTLIAFFTLLLNGPKTLDASWVLKYLLAQFLAGWMLISLEGLRGGNRGRIVSWTGTWGVILQNLTYTVSVPIYLIIHLLTSPISQPSPAADDLAVDPQDLFILPWSVAGGFVVPSVMMNLPSPGTVSASAHYTWLAIWQVFPAVQAVCHWAHKRITAPLNFKENFARQAKDVYRLVVLLTFVPHSALLAVAATPAHYVPDGVIAAIPGLTRDTFSKINLTQAFVPCLPWDSPTVLPKGDIVTPDGLVDLAKMFLQWDIYCGGTAILTWSVFVYSVARPEKSLWSNVLPKALVSLIFGGPVGAAAVLLWGRDTAALKQNHMQAKKTA